MSLILITQLFGIMNLFIINSLDGKIIKKIIQGERNSAFEELHILKPGITWSPNGEKLAVAVKSGKSDALVLINLENNKKIIKRFNLEGIFRPTWNPKKNIIAFIGNNGFSSDIYIYNIDEDSLSNYTNDWIELFGPPNDFESNKPFTKYQKDLAFAVQDKLEKIGIELVKKE